MKAISFLSENWGYILPVLVAVASEYMSLNPNWKANGILQAIINVISKKKE
jgi:hypothetical protein